MSESNWIYGRPKKAKTHSLKMMDVESGGVESAQGVGLEQTAKTCSKCKLAKPFSEFHRNRTRRDGREYTCKKCVASIRTKAHLTATRQFQNGGQSVG